MRRTNEPHWIRRTHLFDPDDYVCSQCQAVFKKKNPVCPRCGTRLALEKREESWVDEAEELSWLLDDD